MGDACQYWHCGKCKIVFRISKPSARYCKSHNEVPRCPKCRGQLCNKVNRNDWLKRRNERVLVPVSEPREAKVKRILRGKIRLAQDSCFVDPRYPDWTKKEEAE